MRLLRIAGTIVLVVFVVLFLDPALFERWDLKKLGVKLP